MIYEGIEFTKPDFINEDYGWGQTQKALKQGILQRQPCEVCLKQGKIIEGKGKVVPHHEIYSDYLGVRWLCISHHLKIHAQFRKLYPRTKIS